MSSYRSYVPWARKEIENGIKEDEKLTPAGSANSSDATDKESQQQDKSDDKTDSRPNAYKDYGSRRYGSSSSNPPRTDLSSYRASNYTPTSSLAPSTRERSISRGEFSSSLTVPSDSSSSYSRPTFGRSASALTEKDLASTPKKDYTRYGGFNYIGSGPHKTVSYTKIEDKAPSSTDSAAFSKYSTSSTSPFSSSRYLKKEQTSTEKLDLPSTSEGRYTYRTRPQPVLKKIDIPPLNVPSKQETPPVLSPAASNASKTFFPDKPTTSSAPEVPLVTTYINITTRATSPNPPSAFMRSRRSEIAREIIKDVPKPPKVESKEKESQTDLKYEDPAARYSRFSRNTTPWTSSLVDKYSTPTSSFASPVSRYMSKVTSDPPKASVTRSSRFESDSPITSLKEKRDAVSAVLTSMTKTPMTQGISTRSYTSRRSPSVERSAPSPILPRRNSIRERSREPVSDYKKAPSPTPTRKLLTRRTSTSEEKLISKDKSSRPASRNTSPEKSFSSKSSLRQSKSPEKQISRISAPLEKQSAQRSLGCSDSSLRVRTATLPTVNKVQSPPVTASNSTESLSTAKKSKSPEKLPKPLAKKKISPSKDQERSASKSPEKQLDRKNSVSKTSLKSSSPSLISRSSKSPSPTKGKSSSPEKQFESPKIFLQEKSLEKTPPRSPQTVQTSTSAEEVSKITSSPQVTNKEVKEKSYSPLQSVFDSVCAMPKISFAPRHSSSSDLCESGSSSDVVGHKLEKRKSLIFKELMESERVDDAPAIEESLESSIVIENLKSVLEDLKADLFREHVIEPVDRGVEITEQIKIDKSQDDALANEAQAKPLTVDLSPISLELSPPTNKKPPLSPSKTEGKLAELKPKKSILNQKHLKQSSSLNALIKPKNKDFRKSPLNMNSSPQLLSPDQESSAGSSPLQERKVKKSQSSEASCLKTNSSSSLPENKLMKTKVQKNFSTSQGSLNFDKSSSLSLSSKLDGAGGSTNDISMSSLSPQQSDANINRMSISPSRAASTTQFIRHSSASRHDSSSTESDSTESESEESEESDEASKPQEVAANAAASDAALLPQRSRSRSLSKVISRNASETSDDPSISLPLDKPPLPPAPKSKEESPNKAASYLMRALAPVTNLFFSKSKDEKSVNTSEADRMDTSQSLSELPLDKSDDQLDQLDSETQDLMTEDTTDLSINRDERYMTLPVRKRPQSQDMDWWLEDHELQARKAEAKEIVISSDNQNIEELEPVLSKEISEEKIRPSSGAVRKSRPSSSGEIPWRSATKDKLEHSASSPKEVSDPLAGNKIRKVFNSSSGVNTLSWCLDSTEDISESESGSESESESSDDKEEEPQPVIGTKKIEIKRIESGEKAWWMQSNADIPEGIARMKSTASMNNSNAQISKAASKISVNEEAQAQVYRIRTQQSGEIARWRQSTENVPATLQTSGSTNSLANSLAKQTADRKASHRKYKIRHIESGEKAWWMQSNDNIPGGVKRTQKNLMTLHRNDTTKSLAITDEHGKQYLVTPIESGEKVLFIQEDDIGSDGQPITRNASLSSVVGSEKIYKLIHVASKDQAIMLLSADSLPKGIMKTESFRSQTGSLKRNESGRSLLKSRLSTTASGDLSGLSNGADGVKRSESIRTRLKNIKRVESGEKAWWMSDDTENVPEGITCLTPDPKVEEESEEESDEEDAEVVLIVENERKPIWIRPAESGERAWWMDNSGDVPEGIEQLTPSESEEESSEEEEAGAEGGEAAGQSMIPKFPLVLEDRTSPDGLEMPSLAGRRFARFGSESPYENIEWLGAKMFIGDTTNIDDILGDFEQPAPEEKKADAPAAPVKERKAESSDSEESSDESSSKAEVDGQSKKVDLATSKTQSASESDKPENSNGNEISAGEGAAAAKLDDAALQILKDGEYGAYLDLDASISEQHEEFDGFGLNRKNSIVLRTQLSVRVHTIIEKLLNSEGRELRRALFSLKQIFQEDKDLVHEFVQNDGLACLIKVGSEVDQNYQNYILRALGQVMLYVDGMNGIMAHNETVQWLYTLIASKFRLVLKTALKLLLVFVEYKESNCNLLVSAIRASDLPQGEKPWYNVMRLLGGYDTSDTELLVYACTLINKTLNGLSDLDMYYDQVDAIEEQGMKDIVQQYMSKQGTDLDLLRQFQIYEAVLHHEDGEDHSGTPLRQLDETIRKSLRTRKGSGVDSPNDRRRSRRCINKRYLNSGPQLIVSPLSGEGEEDDDEDISSNSRSPSPSLGGTLEFIVGCGYENYKAGGNMDMTPGLKKRRERAERQRSLREQQESIMRTLNKDGDDENNLKNSQSGELDVWQNNNNQVSRTPSRQDILMNAVNKIESECENQKEDILQQLSRENTVKDLTQKLSSQNIVLSPSDEKVARLGDMSGLISKAMEGLTKSKSKSDLKPETKAPPPEPKKSETDLQWEHIMESMDRPLELCDLDFTDLNSEDEVDLLAPSHLSNGIPPPPPPIALAQLGGAPPPPPVGLGGRPPAPPPGVFGVNLKHHSADSGDGGDQPSSLNDKLAKKSKKTVKLFWKEVRDDAAVMAKLQKSGFSQIWDELSPVSVDTQKLEHLFESRAKDIVPKKQQDMNKSKEIIVLDPKRSNAINIGMTKLPPPRSIKTAILKMDATVMNREGIEKLFTMLPTEEEKSKILEAQVAHPDVPLGSAEQFLLTLASITELPARLKLWAFKLDYENIEKEIAEPVMDLKQGMEILKANRTFRCILGTLLSIGIFLNGAEVKGFQIEYLAKVPEVKDTVHKHSLLHHLCHMVMEKFTDATDLYSEIGAITRASKVDFDELEKNIRRLETECKASWDHLKVIAKHDGSSAMKTKMSDFLTDCAQRIMVLGTVHRRIMNRYTKFLLWLGTPPHRIQDTKPNEFCRILSEFALEYRTTRERVLQQMEKKANHRERNKTRGKMITEEMPKFRSKEEQNKDDQLRQLLGGGVEFPESESHGTWRRQRKDLGRMHSEVLPKKGDNADDNEILESLVKTATKSPGTRATPRERKRTRHADRKSLRRTLRNGLSDEERKHLAALIKGY